MTADHADFNKKQPSVLATRYAEAFFQNAQSQSKLDRALAEASSLGKILVEAADLHQAFINPALSLDQKIAVIKAVCESRNWELLPGLLLVLARNGRLSILSEVLRAFDLCVARAQGVEYVKIETAQPLSARAKAEIDGTLSASLGGKKLNISEVVDPALIGGMCVHVGSKIIDLSIRGRLARLQTAIVEKA